MTDLFALKELRDKVAAGTATKRDFILSDLVPHDRSAFRAFNGSLDAAKALHEALLPNWSVGMDMTPCDDGLETSVDIWICMLAIESREVVILDYEATTPARAWLLAILDALAHLRAERWK